MNSTVRTVEFFNILQRTGAFWNKSDFVLLKRSFIRKIYSNISVSSSIYDVNCYNARFNKNVVFLCGNSYQTCKFYSTAASPINVEDKLPEAPPLTKENAHSLVMRLTTDERTALMTVLREFEAEQTKAEFKGQLAAFRWRSKFGRPSKMPRLGDVDPTGSYCPVPEDWLLRKYAETVPKPNTHQLFGVALHNSVPFVGFGFLDNFFMIICGDYIELYVGSIITISTMAAAALGNTLSDILGIGSAFYVERAVSKLGLRPPNLSPIQLDMLPTRIAANLGRVVGVTIGCLLGMFPLLFIKKKDETKPEEEIIPMGIETSEFSSGQQQTSISVV